MIKSAMSWIALQLELNTRFYLPQGSHWFRKTFSGKSFPKPKMESPFKEKCKECQFRQPIK